MNKKTIWFLFLGVSSLVFIIFGDSCQAVSCTDTSQCKSGEMCIYSVCTSCTDSDGDDIYTNGYITAGSYKSYDECNTAGAIAAGAPDLFEKTCTGTKGYYCSRQAGPQYSCSGGLCKKFLCQGSIPSGFQAWDAEESTGLTNNTTSWTKSDTDTSVKCEYHSSVVIPAPTLSITATPATIYSGSGTKLEWNVSNATKCTGSSSDPSSGWISNGTNKAFSDGSHSFFVSNITKTTTYSIECWNSNNISSGKKSAIVTVEPKPTLGLTFTFDDGSTDKTIKLGERITMNWTATGAASCLASGNGWTGGEKPLNHYYSSQPTSLGDKTCTLTCKDIDDENSSISKTITYTVESNITPPEPNNPPVVSIKSPEDGKTYPLGENVYFFATATDSDGSIINKRWYANSLIDISSSYSFYYSDFPYARTYTWTFEATDDDGISATDQVTFTLLSSICNGTPPDPEKGEVMCEKDTEHVPLYTTWSSVGNSVNNCTYDKKCQYYTTATSYSCTGSAPDGVKQIKCPNSDTSLSSDAPWSNVGTSVNDCGDKKCAYYTPSDSYSCIGVAPDGVINIMCPNDNAGLTANRDWVSVGSSYTGCTDDGTNTAKCQYYTPVNQNICSNYGNFWCTNCTRWQTECGEAGSAFRLDAPCSGDMNYCGTCFDDKIDCKKKWGDNYQCYTHDQWTQAGSPQPIYEIGPGCDTNSSAYGYCAPTNSAEVDGICGTANGKTYAYSDTSFGNDTFCLAGTVSPANPAFPSPDPNEKTTWTCQGSNGGNNAYCSASRENSSDNFSCTGDISVGSIACEGDNIGLTADTRKTLVSTCSSPAGSAPKCEYVCDSNNGYHFDNTGITSVCTKNSEEFSCYGQSPQDASIWTTNDGIRDDQNLTTSLQRILSATNTSRKCEYKCNQYYKLSSNQCVSDFTNNSCLGDIPQNATLCEGDGTNIEQSGTYNKVVPKCTINKKCEYVCNNWQNYDYRGGTCKKVYSSE